VADVPSSTTWGVSSSCRPRVARYARSAGSQQRPIALRIAEVVDEMRDRDETRGKLAANSVTLMSMSPLFGLMRPSRSLS
jgi:hypothetical protein